MVMAMTYTNNLHLWEIWGFQGVCWLYTRATDPDVSKALKRRNLSALLHSVTSQKNIIL